MSETDEELSNDEDATSFLLQESNDTILTFHVSLNPSGLGRYVTSTNEITIQTDDCNVEKPKIHSNRDGNDKIKATCAQVSKRVWHIN